MALTNGLAVNANGVYAGGPLEVDEAKASAAITPGALVITAATDGQIAEAGDEAINVVGVALENNKAGKAFRTDHASGSFVPFGIAPGMRFMGILKDAEAVVYGDFLVPAASGEVKKYAPDVTATVNETTVEAAIAENAAIVARYIGKADVTASGSTRILCEFLGG